MRTVLLAITDVVFRTGLAMMIDADDELTLVGEADGVERLLRMVEERDPQVVLLDLHLPQLDTVEQVRSLMAGRRVQALAKYSDDPRLNTALLAGAVGFVVRSAAPEEILAALRR